MASWLDWKFGWIEDRLHWDGWLKRGALIQKSDFRSNVLANSEGLGVGRRPILREIEMPVVRDRGVTPQRTEQNAQLGLKRKCYQECFMVNGGCQTNSVLNVGDRVLSIWFLYKPEAQEEISRIVACASSCSSFEP